MAESKKAKPTLTLELMEQWITEIASGTRHQVVLTRPKVYFPTVIYCHYGDGELVQGLAGFVEHEFSYCVLCNTIYRVGEKLREDKLDLLACFFVARAWTGQMRSGPGNTLADKIHNSIQSAVRDELLFRADLTESIAVMGADVSSKFIGHAGFELRRDKVGCILPKALQKIEVRERTTADPCVLDFLWRGYRNEHPPTEDETNTRRIDGVQTNR